MNKTIYTDIIGLIGEDGSLTEQPRFPENQLVFDNGLIAEYAPGEIDGHILYFNGFGFGSWQDAAGELLDAAVEDLKAGNLEAARAKLRSFGTSGRMLPEIEHFLDALRSSAGELLDAAVEDLKAGNLEAARAKLRSFGTSGRMLPEIEHFLDALRSSRDAVDQTSLQRLARELLTEGTGTEEVKAGLCIAESFAELGIPILEDEIRTLAKCDEFTLFCIRIAEHLPDCENTLLEMGRHASVWGHIHLSEFAGQPPADDLPEELAELFCPDFSLDCENTLLEMGRHASVWGHIHLSEFAGQPPADDLPEELAELFCPDFSLED